MMSHRRMVVGCLAVALLFSLVLSVFAAPVQAAPDDEEYTRNCWTWSSLVPITGQIASLGCEVVEDAIQGIDDTTNHVLESMFGGFEDANSDLLTNVLIVSLGRSSFINDSSWAGLTVDIQTTFFLIASGLVVAGVFWQALRMIWNKSGVPLADLIRALGVFLFVAGTGVVLVQLAAKASDELAAVMIGPYLVESAHYENPGGDGLPGIVMILLNLILFFGGFFMVISIFMRDVGVILASGTLVLAASGQFFNFSKQWLDGVIGTIIACLLYKPVLAIIMNIGFSFLQSDVDWAWLLGYAMIIMGMFSMGGLMKYFLRFNYSGGIGSGQSMGTGAVETRSQGGARGQAPAGAA